jgi:hypothetical protein
VSLQAVKGEGGQQRRQRIEREKAAALARACDFCGFEEPAAETGDNSDVLVEIVAPTVESVDAATDAAEEAVAPVAEPRLDGGANESSASHFSTSLAAEVDDAAPAPVEVVPSDHKRRRARTPIRFRVHYVGVREVEASDILAAVARAEAMGLNEIVAVTRVG